MGLINRYRMGALAEKQLNMQARRMVALEHRGSMGAGKRARIVAKTIRRESLYRAKQTMLERNHIEKRVFKEAGKKKFGKMSRSQAAHIAAMARWHGGSGGR
jgi:hypothetical protein